MTELAGSDKAPETYKLVVVTEVAEILEKEVLVVNVMAPLANDIKGVPVTVLVPE